MPITTSATLVARKMTLELNQKRQSEARRLEGKESTKEEKIISKDYREGLEQVVKFLYKQLPN